MLHRCDNRKRTADSLFGAITVLILAGFAAVAAEGPAPAKVNPGEGGRRAQRMQEYLRSRMDPETGMLDLDGLDAAW